MNSRPLYFAVPGDPRPKQLGVLMHGKVVTPKAASAYEQQVRLRCLAEVNRQCWTISSHACSVTLRLFVATRRRVDVDNMAKLLLDGIKRVAFDDDSQVTELHVYKTVDQDKPRVEILVEELADD